MGSVERLTTTAMATDGRAVARRSSGQVVFVDGALPGETVTARTVTDRSRYATSEVVEVLEASPDRVAPPCPHRVEGCGGCPWQHVSLAGQRRMKSEMIEESLRRIGRMEDVPLRPTVELESWAWRTSIRAGVVGGRAALRRNRSHDLVPVDGCLIAHPLLLPLLSGERYRGARSVTLRCGVRTSERLVSAMPRRARLDLPPDVDRRHFHEVAAGRKWRVSAASFFQSRPDGADALARLVVAAAADLAATGRALDAYCGVGLFAGVLAGSGWSVTAVDGSPRSVDDAVANLAGLPVDVVRSDVTAWSPPPADLVVADPSRAGLGAAGVGSLVSSGAARFVLVSCDVASLGRDAGLLASAGYRLSSVTPVDMFPHTWRVEVVSVFDR